MSTLGSIYIDGKFYVEKNLDKGIEWLSKASDKGSAEASVHLGWCYETGIGVLKNAKRAFDLYTAAAEAGSPDGLVYLGFCYETGLGTTKNIEKAAYYYFRAAEIGDLVGLHNLGLCFAYGRGVPKNNSKAFEMLKKSAEGGFAPAKQTIKEIEIEGWLSILRFAASLRSTSESIGNTEPSNYGEENRAMQRKIDAENDENKKRAEREEYNKKLDEQWKRLLTPNR